MNKLLNQLEKIRGIMYYFWGIIMLCAMSAYYFGNRHYERQKKDQYEILMLQVQLYRDSSKMCIDSSWKYEHDWKFAGQAMYFEVRANEMADSAKTILNQ